MEVQRKGQARILQEKQKDIKKMDIFIQYAIAASEYALSDSKLKNDSPLGPKVGVFIASGIGGFSTIEREHKALLDGGPRKISPFFPKISRNFTTILFY